MPALCVTNSILSHINTKVKFYIPQKTAIYKDILRDFCTVFLVLILYGLYNLNMNSRAQIIATIGRSSESVEMLKEMSLSGMNVVRLNFSWGNFDEKKVIIENIRKVELSTGKKIQILADLPGPRIQTGKDHTYNSDVESSFTDNDKEVVKFGIKEKIDFFALSFVGSADDVVACSDFIKSLGGVQKVIAKIERKVAVENMDEIIRVSDAVMVARGDLGNEIPIEELPFVQMQIVKKCKSVGKPVIVATQMLYSMVENSEPTRAEVTDVSMAITEGADAVMLSEETAKGKYPVESVRVMEKIVSESEKHLNDANSINQIGYLKSENINHGKLVIVRHQESEWNKLGQWTGSRDVHLTEGGFAKSKELGELVEDICFDHAFASMQVRSIETLSSILSVCMADSVLPTEHVSALNERDYGDYTGKNKWEMEKIIGEEEFNKIRRGWDCPIPNGESLKMVYERVVPFFTETVVPMIDNGKNVLIVSHGNTIRALMKYIERISDEDISSVEMLFSDIVIYSLDGDGHMINKEVRSLKN